MPKTMWQDSHVNVDVTSGSQTVLSLFGTVSAVETRLQGLTLLRTIIRIDLAPTVMDQGEGSTVIDFAIGIGGQEQVAASSVPDANDPAEQPPRGWIFKTRYRVWGTAADRAVVVWREIDKDLRSRRKLDNGEPYMVVDNSPQEGATQTIRVVGLIRQLWLVH